LGIGLGVFCEEKTINKHQKVDGWSRFRSEQIGAVIKQRI